MIIIAKTLTYTGCLQSLHKKNDTKLKTIARKKSQKKGNTQPIESLYLNWLNTKTHWTPCMYMTSNG